MKLDAAERLVEQYCNRRLMKAIYTFKLSAWPVNGIVLPLSPVLSVDSVKYYDSSNTLQTWSSSNYNYNVAEEPTRIGYVNGTPGLYDRPDAVAVEFTCGYSSSSTTATQQAAVPPALKLAILKLVNDLYNFRNDGVKEKITSWQVMAYPYRVFHHPSEND